MKLRDSELLVFAKAPVPGLVKTRLVSALGEQQAVELHAALVRWALRVAIAAQLVPVSLWCSPSRNHPFFKECAKRYGIALRTQKGNELGQRMANALQQTHTRCRYALLIGTDCPGLSACDLEAALAALQQGCDAVLGPAQDGGYVLIGTRRPVSGLFSGIEWGSDRVLAQTRQRLAALGLRWHELPLRWDVDRYRDVVRLRREMPHVLESLPEPIRHHARI